MHLHYFLKLSLELQLLGLIKSIGDVNFQLYVKSLTQIMFKTRHAKKATVASL